MILQQQPRAVRVAGVAALLVTAWLGINSVWGLTDPGGTAVSDRLQQVGPLAVWVAAATALIGAVALAAVWRGDRGLLSVSAVLLAYLAGVTISRYAKMWVDPAPGIPLHDLEDAGRALFERSFLLLPALPMLVVAGRLLHGRLPLRFGDWRSGNWRRAYLLALLLIGLPGFLVMQSTVGFAPLESGTLWPALLPVLALAGFNAFTEELLFRGLIQAPLVAYLGKGWGVSLQAVFFAIHHWGASPSLIAGGPTAIILVLLAVWMGRSVLETGGLGWAVCFHMLLDFVFFAAYFVPSA